jgi:site-specific recombinase XerC
MGVTFAPTGTGKTSGPVITNALNPRLSSDDPAQHVPRADELSGAPSRYDAGKRAAVWGQDSGVFYSPHSLRATTATLLLDTSVPIESVQDLLDHKHITTTQIYDKRCRRRRFSHKVLI